jgi:hypothetical protein
MFVNGGGRGIRTPVTLSGKAVFKTACFNRSHIPPRECCQQLTSPDRIAKRTVFLFTSNTWPRILRINCLQAFCRGYVMTRIRKQLQASPPAPLKPEPSSHLAANISGEPHIQRRTALPVST